MKLNEILRGLNKEKKVLKQHQTVDLHARATQVGRERFGCPCTTSNSNFKNYIKVDRTTFFPASGKSGD